MKDIYELIVYYNTEQINIAYSRKVEFNKFMVIVMVYAVWSVFAEEFFYRNTIFLTLIKECKYHKCILLFSVIVFAIAHTNSEQIVHATFIGLILYLVMFRKQSLTMCVIIHIWYNALGLINTYYFPDFLIKFIGVEKITQQNDIVIAIVKLTILFVVMITALYYFMRTKVMSIQSGVYQDVKCEKSGQPVILFSYISVVVIYGIYRIIFMLYL